MLPQPIRAQHPDLPLILLGLSWGSFLAQILLDAHPDAYDALVLSGSALRTPGSLSSGNLNKPWKSAKGHGLQCLLSDDAVGVAFVEDALTTSAPLLRLFGPSEPARLFGRPRPDLGRDIPVLLMEIGRAPV